MRGGDGAQCAGGASRADEAGGHGAACSSGGERTLCPSQGPGQGPGGEAAQLGWGGTWFSSWMRTSRSGAPSASRSGTRSRGLRTDTFPPKRLGWLHKVFPETEHSTQHCACGRHGARRRVLLAAQHCVCGRHGAPRRVLLAAGPSCARIVFADWPTWTSPSRVGRVWLTAALWGHTRARTGQE